MIYVAAIRVAQLLLGPEDGSIAGFLADPFFRIDLTSGFFHAFPSSALIWS
jgi:hypothetical protein